MYVGQTFGNAVQRFAQHVQKARTLNTPLAKAIRHFGFRAFGIFPVERIDPKLYASNSKKTRKGLFRKVANIREQFWIDRLHTGPNKGWNVQWTMHTSKQHIGLNPMKWRRELKVDIKQSLINISDSKQPYTQKYSSPRNWQKRCSILAERLKDKILNNLYLEKFKRTTLWKMIKYLKNNDPSPNFAAYKENLILYLLSFLSIRPQQAKIQSKVPHLTLHLYYSSNILKRIPFKKIITSSSIKALLPTQDILIDHESEM